MPTGTAPTSEERAGRTALRRLVMLALVLVAVGALVLAVRSADTDRDPNAAISGGAVEGQLPAEASSVPQQSKVAIDLVSGWTGELIVNGVEIPEEELIRNAPLNLIEFQPGPDQTFERLRAGENCASATIWPIAEGPGGTSQRVVVWCWEVV